jgi:hydrogenase expression/formation protein HypC
LCLAVPGQIVSIADDELRSGIVQFGGVRRAVCLACIPEASVGDYVIVHVGFAIGRIDEEEAMRTLALFAELEPEAAERERPR